ncbi:hypothetical protein DESC_370084 [Desulfosarcina cetonica]|nr:hypothetical protein DESC_370084 [Desulfosarcina cetonica]
MAIASIVYRIFIIIYPCPGSRANVIRGMRRIYPRGCSTDRTATASVGTEKAGINPENGSFSVPNGNPSTEVSHECDSEC